MAAGHAEISDVGAGAAWSSPSLRLRTMRRLEVGVVALVLAVLTAVVADVEVGLAAVASVVGGVLVHATQVRAGLLVVAHGLHEAVPAPPAERLVAVPNSRLIAAGCLTGVIPAGLVALIALAVLGSSERAALLAGGSGMFVLW